MGKEKKYIYNQEGASWKIVDDEVVIINFETTHYYSLNATGSYVWRLLEKEAIPLSQIITSVSKYFDVPEDVVQNDVTTLIDDLYKEKLILEN